MIEGKGWRLIEIPYTGSVELGEILLEQVKGARSITPKFLSPEPIEGIQDFTILRKPYQRYRRIYGEPSEVTFEEWYDWSSSKDDPHYLFKPYSYWVTDSVKFFHVEALEDVLPSIEKIVGAKLEVPFKLFRDDVRTGFSKETLEFIKDQRSQDFYKFRYKIDVRKKI